MYRHRLTKDALVDGTTLRKFAMETGADLPGVTHTHPFGPEHDVFKVAGKVFLMTTEVRGTPIVTVKCDPLDAELLRHHFESITAGYHMNKRHWMSIAAGPDITEELVEDLVTDSYQLVVAGLPKSRRPIGSEGR